MKRNETSNKIIEYLFRNPHATRVDIHKYLGISPAAVTKLVKQMIDNSEIIETGNEISQSSGAGRSKQIISLNKQIGNYIGISFTFAGLAICLADITGKVIAKNFVEFNILQTSDLNDLIINKIKEITVAYPNLKILGVGFAIPGHFDAKKCIIISNNSMWNGFNLKKIQKEINLPVVAENNVESMADAKYLFGHKKINEKFIFLHVGYGIYSAFIEPNHLYPKNNYSVGEIGHSIVKLDGFKCECGKEGCLQTYISETWLIKRAKLLYRLADNSVLKELVKDINDINLQTIFNAYELKDDYIVKIIDEGIKYLSISVSNLLMIYDADTIYINSPLLQKKDFKVQLLKLIQNQLQFINSEKNTVVDVLPYDKYNGALGGCSLVALSQVVQNPAYRNITLGLK